MEHASGWDDGRYLRHDRGPDPIIHLRGDYLLIVTIGIVEIVRIALINNVFDITRRGPTGIFGISRPTVFGYKISKTGPVLLPPPPPPPPPPDLGFRGRDHFSPPAT